MADPKEPKKKPTLKTISQLTGLAVPTVSRALSDAPDIGKATKERVRQVAREIGYVPNRAGVRLRTGRTNVIALVLTAEHNMMNHTAQLITSTASVLRGTNYHLNVMPYFPDDDPMDPIRYIVETGSADAVILNQTLPEDPRVAYLLERNFPFATHGRTNWAKRHPYFDYDNHAFSMLAIKCLAHKGRKNLLFIAPPSHHFYGDQMRLGAIEGAQTYNVLLSFSDHITSDSENAEIKTYIADAVERDPTIDGIVCGSTNAAMASVAGMESLGHDVATDIDVVAKEAIPFLNLFRQGILVLNEDVARAGEFLAHAAIQAIRDPDAAPLQGLDVPQKAPHPSA